MKDRVVLLSEGGKGFGFGHVSRTLSIYEEVEKLGKEVLLYIKGDHSVLEMLADTKYKICNWQNKEFVKNELNASDYVLVDSYKVDLDILELISKKVKKVSYIDDYNRIEYPKGTVINPAFYGKELDYDYNRELDYALGEKYIILRKEFIGKQKKRIEKEINEVLITFGGTDVLKLTSFVLESVKGSCENAKINVVIGKGFSDIEQFKKNENENVFFYYNIDAKQMCDLMLKSDLVVSAAGQTLNETTNIAVPTVAIKVAENQRYNIATLYRMGCILEANKDNLIKKLEKIKSFKVREKLFLNCKKLVVGKGAKNIALKIIEDPIKLREANEKDVDDIYNLSNENIVRKNSLNTNKIDYHLHTKWYENELKAVNINFYVVYTDNEKFLGQIRFEIKDRTAIISLSLSEKIRGKGRATSILAKAINRLKIEEKVDKIVSYIKISNIPSLRIFEKFGFDYIEENNGIKKYEYTIER
jgi:spore coat polysaccharide biosynthesis predicted glycosyltransferase SpsG/RimJ/RimL family protein N-acetyltransferase